MKRINFDFVKKVSLIVLVCILLFVASFSRPYKVQALPIAAIALGSGALGAVVAAYFATAGVQLSGGSSDADGSFLGNYVANWVKSSSSFPNNGYFNSDGEFTGNNTDLSIVQNEDTGLVSFIFGKELAIWLEALKASFVSQSGLQENVSTSLYDESGLNDMSGNFFRVYHPVYENGNQIVNVSDINEGGFDFYNKGVSFIAFSEDSAIRVTSPYSGSLTNAYIQFGTYNNSEFVVTSGRVFSSDAGRSLVFAYYNNSLNVCSWGRLVGNKYFLSSLGTILDSQNLDYKNIELSGELTEGYQDFEDAINNDLTNADDEEVAVVDVGSFPDILNPTDLISGILDRIIDRTLDPTYDGTRENTQKAEEEKEGNQPFVPQYPSDWVVVNGIQSFFPFCIPWDLAYIIGLLQAEPVAPNFTWVMDFGRYADPYTIHIDLAPFETVAIVFRTMIVFLFLIFLIKKSRDLIRG